MNLFLIIHTIMHVLYISVEEFESLMAKKPASPRPQKPSYRFGIGEWYGKSFVALSTEERRAFAQLQLKKAQNPPECPFLSKHGRSVECWKVGGVCSLRLYEKTEQPTTVGIAATGSTIRATCPSRFEQDDSIYHWVGEILLGRKDAVPIGQVNFLERIPLEGAVAQTKKRRKEVGRFDNVLVVPGSKPLQWCPLEIQAVYFSGKRMAIDFKEIARHVGDSLPFPRMARRPDYRSSGPKRLMPQLQIKVPTLRRWGKKIGVVVDDDFFKNLGKMETVDDVSNSDVVWFVCRFEETEEGIKLQRGVAHYTTLESSVEGLVAGRPVTQNEFEKRIFEKYQRLGSAPVEIPSNE